MHLRDILIPVQGEIHHVMNPDPYRGVFGSDASHYANEVQDHIAYATPGKVAGFIAETFQVYFHYFFKGKHLCTRIVSKSYLFFQNMS